MAPASFGDVPETVDCQLPLPGRVGIIGATATISEHHYATNLAGTSRFEKLQLSADADRG
jgi:hypothetical protein